MGLPTFIDLPVLHFGVRRLSSGPRGVFGGDTDHGGHLLLTSRGSVRGTVLRPLLELCRQWEGVTVGGGAAEADKP